MSTTLTKSAQSDKGYKGLAMEGFIARWYARNTGKDIGEYRALAQDLAGQLQDGAHVLEVAPGPGYLAIELAKLGHYGVVGLDISETFVRMAAENAERAGVEIPFHRGDAASMPFDPDSFDLIVCRAAFKNFSRPVQALNEMYRVLKIGGKALIIDLRPDASADAINAYVRGKGLGWFNSALTKLIFKHSLVKRAYSQDQFGRMASETLFKSCEIKEEPLGMQVTFLKR
jgi:ubiquinone/menaquinone biosynthesis C-methylase UbiE